MGFLFHRTVGERLLAPPFVHRPLSLRGVGFIRPPFIFRSVVILNFVKRIGVLITSPRRFGLFESFVEPIEEVVDDSRSVSPTQEGKHAPSSSERGARADFHAPHYFSATGKGILPENRMTNSGRRGVNLITGKRIYSNGRD